ncbi:MAG: YihA family ribosome biogenesis GTP-binding protein, partial [bacterium]|nr:YihA family ribosome biogenesis GTP-binding protein [bacterium]
MLKIKDLRLAAAVFTEKQLIDDDVGKIVFIGRSNVGKSSFINKIVNRKKLAKTSSKPGKTVSINYYLINEMCYFVDLPGYGYAKISKKESQRVRTLISTFFEKVGNVKLVVLLIDSRRGFMDADIEILSKILNKGFKLLTVLTKSDKLRNSELLFQKNNLQNKYGLKVVTFSIKSVDNETREEILGKKTILDVRGVTQAYIEPEKPSIAADPILGYLTRDQLEKVIAET